MNGRFEVNGIDGDPRDFMRSVADRLLELAAEVDGLVRHMSPTGQGFLGDVKPGSQSGPATYRMAAAPNQHESPPDNLANKKVLTNDSLAKYLGMGKSTIAGWRRKGVGPKCFYIGRRPYYLQTEVDKWMDSCIGDNSFPRGIKAAYGRKLAAHE